MIKSDLTKLDESNNELLKTSRKIRIQAELNKRVRVLICQALIHLHGTPIALVKINFFQRSRITIIVEARHCIWKVLLESKYTTMDIARTFNVDHSSVVRANQRMDKFIEKADSKNPKLIRYARILKHLREVNSKYTDKLITENTSEN